MEISFARRYVKCRHAHLMRASDKASAAICGLFPTKYEYEGEGAYQGEHEKDGRLRHIDDGKGTQTYTYDETTGLPKELTDSAAGTFSAAYDVEGHLISEGYPNAMSVNITGNQAGQITGVQYVKNKTCTGTCPETWYSDNTVPSIHGQWITQASSFATNTYSYDNAGRLIQGQDTPTGGGCVTRVYAYDEETNRLGATTRQPGTGGVCATEGGTVESHAYDSANRLIDAGTAYDPFGNTTSLPAADAGGFELASTYFTDNQVATQAQNGQTLGYQIDPAGRTREIVSTGKVTATEIQHYSGPGNGPPSWTGELSTNYTRYITGISGMLVAIQHNGETPVLQVANLHGDIVATATDSEAATKLASTISEASEYGVPATEAPPKYSWLGAHQVPTALPSGVMTMGVRSYIPQLGRFLQTDPVSGGSANAYAYTLGNPVNESDLSGADGMPAWLIEANNREAGELTEAATTRRIEAEERKAAEEAAAQAAAQAAAEAAAQAAAAAAIAAGSPYGENYFGEEEWWGEEEGWEEEGEEWGMEGVSYHSGSKPTTQKAHTEEGSLYQPLNEDGEVQRLSAIIRCNEKLATHSKAKDHDVCARYADLWGWLGQGYAELWKNVKEKASWVWKRAMKVYHSIRSLWKSGVVKTVTQTVTFIYKVVKCTVTLWKSGGANASQCNDF